MLKKLLFAGGGVVLLVTLLFGRDACSYLGTTVGKVHRSVKDSVPVQFELDRARAMIRDLGPEIKKNTHLIVKEEVAVQHLETQLEKLQGQLEKDRGEVMQLKTDLDTGNSTFDYAGHRYTETQVRTDLANRFARFKTNDATSEKLGKVLEARKRGLDAARDKLKGMLAARRELEVDVANLEARQKMVEVAQTTSDFNFDNSHLARTKEVITDIRTRIEVAERMVDANRQFHDEIPLEMPVQENVSDEIAQYFGLDVESEIESLADLRE